MNDPNIFKGRLKEYLICSESSIRGSWIWWPRGIEVRSAIFDGLRSLVASYGYAEIILPNLVSSNSVHMIDSLDSISQYYTEYSANTYIAASHEAIYYSEIFADPCFGRDGTTRHFFVSPAFRHFKRTLSAYRIGERSSFFQCYGSFVGIDAAEAEMNSVAESFYRYVFEELKVPCLYVDRPVYGNKRLYQRCTSIEMVTPFKRTLTGPMFYFHGDLYSNIFEPSKSNINRHVIHFGVTDYLIINFLYSYMDSDGFINLGMLSPIQVSVSTKLLKRCDIIINDLKKSGYQRVAVGDQTLESECDPLDSSSLTMCFVGPVENSSDLLCTWRVGENLYSVVGANASELVSKACVFIGKCNDRRKNKILSDSIVHVDNFDHMNQVLQNGLIASFFLSGTEPVVKLLHDRIEVGELLGRKRDSTAFGECIVSGDLNGEIHFASKRI